VPEPAIKKEITTDDPRITAALSHLDAILVAGERLEAFAVQRRLFALFHRRTVVAATSGRFIALSRGLFGGFHPHSIRWQDLKTASIDVGVFGACLRLVPLAPRDLAMTESSLGVFAFGGLRKEQAQALYRLCQGQDQAWRETRRIRELEELRARSGGVQIGTSGGGTVGGSAANPNSDPVARLARAKEMLSQGLINDSEFESIKSKIVSEL
jgi:hypothetical protein